MKKVVLALIACLAVAGCSRDAHVASRNLSYAADNFELTRRVVFYNGITGEYILTIQGRCAVEAASRLAVTCKLVDGTYVKHYLGLSDNVTYFSEQLAGAQTSTLRYRVAFKPTVIVPNVELEVD